MTTGPPKHFAGERSQHGIVDAIERQSQGVTAYRRSSFEVCQAAIEVAAGAAVTPAHHPKVGCPEVRSIFAVPYRTQVSGKMRQ